MEWVKSKTTESNEELATLRFCKYLLIKNGFRRIFAIAGVKHKMSTEIENIIFRFAYSFEILIFAFQFTIQHVIIALKHFQIAG